MNANRTMTIRNLWTSGILVVSASLAGCDGGSSPEPAAPAQPLELHGVWDRSGYGDALVVDGNGADLYQYTRVGCIEAERLSNYEVSQIFNESQLSNDSAVLTTLPTDGLAFEARFERLDALPARCVDAVINDSTPTATFEHLWSTFNDYYAFFNERGVNWDSLYNDVRPMVSDDMSDADLLEAVAVLLEPLDDAHVQLFANGEEFDFADYRGANAVVLESFPQQTEYDDIQAYADALSSKYRDIRRSYIDGGSLNTGSQSEHVRWGLIGGRVGYLRIGSMTELSANGNDVASNLSAIKQEMNAVMADLQSTEAMIIDVRVNGGGEDAVSLAIASYFTDQRRLAVSKVARSYAGDTPQVDAYIEPANDTPYVNPVAVLGAPDTASAAEIFLMAMSSLPQVTLVGENSHGILSDILSKTLPNGWEIGLSNEVYQDAFGINHEVTGVTPQVIAETFSLQGMSENRDPAIDAALNTLGYSELSLGM